MEAEKLPPDSAVNDPRIGLAAERTLLAWIRTGLSMMGFGFVVARFGLFLRELAAAQEITSHHLSGVSFWVGTLLIGLGVLVLIVAAVQHVQFVRRLTGGRPWTLKVSTSGLALTIVLACVGVGLATYLLMSTR